MEVKQLGALALPRCSSISAASDLDRVDSGQNKIRYRCSGYEILGEEPDQVDLLPQGKQMDCPQPTSE